MLSHTSKYALKALHFISKAASEKQKLPAIEIAERTGIPKPFLSKLLKQLASIDLVSSQKGPNGGFYLNHDQMEKTIMDVIIHLEGKDSFKACILNFEACNEQEPCPIHSLVAKEKSGLRAAINRIKISDLSDDLTYLEKFDP